jgi:pentatricopeptide repeat protein
VLSIHPDYLLRNYILERMKERWISLSTDGWHDVVHGLLREQQFERAMDMLEAMHSEGLAVKSWLYESFILALSDVEDFDEALRMLEWRIHHGHEISPTVWMHMLDNASRLLHHPTTRFIWQRQVETSYLNPSDGLCLQILNVAARHGDAFLATDVFRILGNRSVSLEAAHYEALLEAYMARPEGVDLKTVFSILSVMEKAGLEPTMASTRPLLKYLLSKDDEGEAGKTEVEAKTTQAMDVLHLLSATAPNRPIPLAAINTIIEAHIINLSPMSAVRTYKQLHRLRPSGPNTETFNIILRGSTPSLAVSLYQEMKALKIPKDALTYDRLIIVFLNAYKQAASQAQAQDALDHALSYHKIRHLKNIRLRRGTYVALFKALEEAGDERRYDPHLFGEKGRKAGQEIYDTKESHGLEKNEGRNEVNPEELGEGRLESRNHTKVDGELIDTSIGEEDVHATNEVRDKSKAMQYRRYTSIPHSLAVHGEKEDTSS